MQRSVKIQLFKITPMFVGKQMLIKCNCNFNIDSIVIRKCTEAIYNIILVKAGTGIESNNVEIFEVFASRFVGLEVLDNATVSLCRYLTDKSTMPCFMGINNQTNS